MIDSTSYLRSTRETMLNIEPLSHASTLSYRSWINEMQNLNWKDTGPGTPKRDAPPALKSNTRYQGTKPRSSHITPIWIVLLFRICASWCYYGHISDLLWHSPKLTHFTDTLSEGAISIVNVHVPCYWWVTQGHGHNVSLMIPAAIHGIRIHSWYLLLHSSHRQKSTTRKSLSVMKRHMYSQYVSSHSW